jgi:hypothetical protein
MLDMVLNKQFSRDVDSKGSQNMGVKRRLLVVGMFWVCDFVYHLSEVNRDIADLRLTTLMAVQYMTTMNTFPAGGPIVTKDLCTMVPDV